MADSTSTTPEEYTRSAFLSGKRLRFLKETITAYLFLFPAMFLIFVFGLFPVAFSLYVSLFRWKIKQGNFIGLGNYTKAMDNLTYVVAFILAAGAIWLAVSLVIKTWQNAVEKKDFPWPYALPGVLFSAAMYLFIKFCVLVLPEILKIGEKVQRMEKTRELYLQLFGEAFRLEPIVQVRQQMLGALLAAVALWFVFSRLLKCANSGWYVYRFFGAGFFAFIGYLIAVFTLTSINQVYASAQAGEAVVIWPQVLSILGGLILLYASWWLWQKSLRQDSSLKLILGLVTAVTLLGGAWLLMNELPRVIEAGDKMLWEGMVVTAWYSFGTVPVQLAIGLGVAYLLYQDIRAKSFFRMIYFLPYITPAVASAAVFRLMFSNRPTGMMNNVLAFFGRDPQKWLLEPASAFSILGIAGPSLALLVIIVYNVWTYAGYNSVIFLAGLGGISRSFYEAAEIDGANRWQLFRYITLPLLSPITYFLSILGVIGTFKAFNHVFVLRNPAALRSVDTMTMVIWDLLKTDNQYGYSAAMAFILFGVVLVLTIINNNLQGKRVFYG